MERKVSFRLLQIIASYGLINMVAVLLFLYFKLNFYPYVALGELVLMVGWLQFCILQYRIYHYEKLLVEYSVLSQLMGSSPIAAGKALSVKREVGRFEKSFPLTIKIVKFLEGRK